METVMLISASPRRQELLRNAGIPFRAAPSGIEEGLQESEDPREAVLRIAHEKMTAFLKGEQTLGCNLALSADTFVNVCGKNIGKPSGREQAEEYLRILSGRVHQVYTGMVLFSRKNNNRLDCVEMTDVRFSPLTDEDIEWYLDSGEWQNAAGAYKIQGCAQCLVESVRGSFSNIMGLPMHRLYEMLRILGYQL